MNSWLDVTWANNEAWRFGALAICVLAALIIGRLIRGALFGAAVRRAAQPVWAATLASGARASVFILFVLGLDFGLGFLRLSEAALETVRTTYGVLITLSLAWLAWQFVNVAEAWLHKLGANGRRDQTLAPLVRNSLRIIVVLLTLLQIATQLSGKPPSSLIAGLGVGGLALALAAQETIKNLFGSVVLLTDKPFELGDVIRVDGHEGPVEKIGMRSTRIRTPDGFLVTLPNGELANKTIINIGKRSSIRRVITLSLPDTTPPAQMQRALEIVKDVLRDHEGQRPDLPPRVHFADITNTALTIQAIYWYHPAEQWAYMAHAEQVNLAILEKFTAEGIALVAPTAINLVGTPRSGPVA
ncbi:MAG: mechanosensitive ion channel family protein [Kiritimatiellaeota bacterium]|nr:mechanosensitive ion channel family protein [Kiritimatiellota bacterium]